MGLVRGMARTAVIAGTATSVSNRVSRRQARRWGAQEQYADPGYGAAPAAAPAPPPPQYAAPAPESGTLAAELERLGDLRQQGLLSEEEFNAAKAKLLGV